ncbi:MAG: response regulator [Betaproteobacteria bacterium]|nr:response regulator [Betaproteobacteria bacterium]MDE2210293.1 response regulator [Betaproteobacteria bacterium]
MYPPCTVSPALVARARADQVATLYAHVHLTSLSMGLGALILSAAMWGQVSAAAMTTWCVLIAVNQAWRTALARAFARERPGADAAPRWGRYWAAGSTIAGALWGLAAVAAFPREPALQALLIVCLFGVVLGGLYLTAVYKPSLYGFVLPALLPLIVRVAVVGDSVHFFLAGVMAVVLGFVLGFGHRLNDVLTRSLVIRYENIDLIGELKERTRSAVEARSAAEAANRAKSQLLAAASHDLRQPLHALGLYVAALSARARNAEWRPLIINVETAANALERQFAQLIDLSRLDAGVLTPERGSVALPALFERIACEFAPQAAARGLAFRIAPTSLCVDSDAGLLERIVGNLVANAIRYTSHGGVLVGARRRGNRVAIDVVDTGVGIAAGDRERIFEEFYQVADRSAAPSAGRGMGLGLAIVRRFADLLGHAVELDSVPGEGSRFRVLAPRARGLRLRTLRAVPAPGLPASVPRSELADRVVAVVDDDPATVDAMTTLFETWGATVVGSQTLDGLMTRIGDVARYPDLVVADLRLADGDSGIRAVRRLRDELGYPVPAIIVSGDTGTHADREARAAGLLLLGKPVVPSTLEAAAVSTIRRYATAAIARI